MPKTAPAVIMPYTDPEGRAWTESEVFDWHRDTTEQWLRAIRRAPVAYGEFAHRRATFWQGGTEAPRWKPDHPGWKPGDTQPRWEWAWWEHKKRNREEKEKEEAKRKKEKGGETEEKTEEKKEKEEVPIWS